MRLFLDAQVSGRRTGAELRRRGHDLRAASDERWLDTWADEALLELAAAESRIMITFNVSDFARIAQRWSEAGRHHSGVLLVVGLTPGHYGPLMLALEKVFADRPQPQDWADYVAFVTHRSP